MKKIYILILIFIIYTLIVNFCPIVTEWDRGFIILLQSILSIFPVSIALLPDLSLYVAMLITPIFCFSILFFRKKLYLNILFFAFSPLVTFLLNCLIKNFVQRPRPPIEFQSLIHPDSYSYVSSHSLITAVVWLLTAYYTKKYVQSKFLKCTIFVISIIWVFFVGLSRIWLGVHNPSDVIGAYLLAILIFSISIKFFSKLKNKSI